jgi:hypothetical protein
MDDHAGPGKSFGVTLPDDPKARAAFLKGYAHGWTLRHGVNR